MTRATTLFSVYLATGDSLTGGYWTTEADGSKRFAYLVAQSLQQALNHANTFVTHPTPGAGIDTALISMRSSLAQYEPQIVVVEWGINNVNASLAAATFRAKYDSLLDLILESGANRLIVCCNVPWFGYTEGGALWNIALEYNIEIAASAAARNLPIADCWTPMALQDEYLSDSGVTYYYPTESLGDSAHPNDAGHQAIHNAIWTVLEPIVTANYRDTATGRGVATGRASATGRGAA